MVDLNFMGRYFNGLIMRRETCIAYLIGQLRYGESGQKRITRCRLDFGEIAMARRQKRCYNGGWHNLGGRNIAFACTSGQFSTNSDQTNIRKIDEGRNEAYTGHFNNVEMSYVAALRMHALRALKEVDGFAQIASRHINQSGERLRTMIVPRKKLEGKPNAGQKRIEYLQI
jgi:hypothetical protein